MRWRWRVGPAGWVAAAAVTMAVWPAGARAGLTEWHLSRARSSLEQGNYRAAIDAYQKVLDDSPRHREALKGLGATYEAAGEPAQAIATYDRFLQRYVDDAALAFRQARLLSSPRYAHRRADVLRFYRYGLALEDRPVERLALARLLAQDDATADEAVPEFRRLVQASPADRGLRAEYRAVLLRSPEHRDEAIRELERHVNENPGDAEAGRRLAALLADRPERLDDAVARYQVLLARAPKNRGLRVELAKALARDPARVVHASEELERAMDKAADRETRVLHADLLAAQPERRDAALAEYRALLDESPGDVAVRVRYAQLLAARPGQLAEAVEQYERALTFDPYRADAHAGLARAYAWRGEGDRALWHQRRAVRLGGGDDPALLRLGEELTHGRSPRVGSGVRMFVQPGLRFHLLGIQLPVTGKLDVNEFITATAEAGIESFQGPASVSATGLFVAADTEVRFTRTERMRVGLGWRGVRPGAERITAFGELEHRRDAWLVRTRLERLPVMDSFRSMVGEATGGAVSAHVLKLTLEYRQQRVRAWATPKLALLAGTGTAATYQLGFDGGANLRLWDRGTWSLAAGYDATTSHFGADRSVSTMGGYYSPALHLVQTPRVTLRHAVDDTRWFELSGGPSIQYERLHTGASHWMPGFQARLASQWQLTRAVELSGHGGLSTIGDLLRMDAGISAQVSF